MERTILRLPSLAQLEESKAKRAEEIEARKARERKIARARENAENGRSGGARCCAPNIKHGKTRFTGGERSFYNKWAPHGMNGAGVSVRWKRKIAVV